MAVDVRGVDVGPRTEELRELSEGGHLPRRRRVVLEVSDQTDTDPVRVEIIALAPDAEIAPAGTLAVGARDLTFPAGADVDPAVLGIHAVADHEVIAETVAPPAHPAVIAVHALRRAVVIGGMVDDDHVPAATSDAARRDELALVQSRMAIERRCPVGLRPGRPGHRRRRDGAPRYVCGLEQGVREGTGADSGWLGAAAQRGDEHASAQCNPLHRADSLCFRAGHPTWSRLHYTACDAAVQSR